MTISVLGPLQSGGPALSPRERIALSVLVLRRPLPVRPEELADAMWDEHPPETWSKQVQVCVSRLRRKLPPHAVETVDQGYRFVMDEEDLDVAAFETRASRARALVIAGEPDRAASAHAGALALWRGEPYGDLAGWSGADSERARLRELRHQIEEELLEARLSAGEHRVVAAEATALVAADPLRERRWALLALAQYRCGRQGDALETLRRARRTLQTELGVDPGHELVELERAILEQDLALESPAPAATVSSECPYQGLAPFGPEDEEAFFGRAQEVQRCLSRIGETGLLVLTGPSGCGKSSLARAGLMPSLTRRGRRTAYLVPGQDPIADLRATLADVPEGGVLIVDQVEELFLLGHAEEVTRAFCRMVAEAATTRAVVLAVRVDQLGGLGAEPRLGELVERGLHLVRALDDAQLREVIEAPAAAAGLRFEPGLVDLLLRDAGEGSGSLPLLSHTLVETWKRRDGAVLTVDGYRASGGISGAVARTADRLYEALSDADRTACRTVLLHLVELPADGPPVRRRLSSRVLQGDAGRERVLADLVRARLLTMEEDSVEIAHEALVRAWPRLQSWLVDDAVGVRILRHLTLAAEGWDGLGRPDSELYRGSRLDLALEWCEGDHVELTPLEQEFVAASQSSRSAQEADARAAVAREARSNRRLRALLTATTGMLVLALLAGGLAFANRTTAIRERTSAQIQALVGSSLALRATDRATAALLAVEAYQRFPDDARTRSALLATFTADPGFFGYRRFADASRLDGAVVPGTSTAVLVLDGQRAVILDLDSPGSVQPLADVGSAGTVSDATVRISADGTRVAVLSSGLLTVDDLPAGRRVLGPVTAPPWRDLAISATGDLVATAEVSGPVTVTRVDDGRTLGTIPAAGGGDTEGGAGLAFARTGELLVGSGGGVVRIVDPDGLRVLREVTGPQLSSNIAIVPVDPGLAVAAGSRRLVAFDPSTGQVRWESEHRASAPAPCWHFAVVPEMQRVYCGDSFGVIEERDLTTGVRTGVTLDVQLNDVGDLAVADDGRELVVFGAFEPVLSRWRLDGSGPVTRLIAEGQVAMDGFEPTGQAFVSAVRPAAARFFDDMDEFFIWDPVTDEARAALPGPLVGAGWVGPEVVLGFHPQSVELRTFDAQTGALLRSEPLPEGTENVWPETPRGVRYMTFDDGRVWTLDAQTNERVEPTLQLAGNVQVVAPSPDGSRLAAVAGVSPGQLTLHDAATGELLAGPVHGVDKAAISDHAVVGARGGSVTVYDADTLEPVLDLPGARGEVNLMTFSADGHTLMATSNDQTVSVYDTREWVRLGDPIPAEAPLIYPGHLNPDGDTVLVTVARGVAEWRLDGDTLRRAACVVAGRNLTATEWTAHLSDFGAYRETCSE